LRTIQVSISGTDFTQLADFKILPACSICQYIKKTSYVQQTHETRLEVFITQNDSSEHPRYQTVDNLRSINDTDIRYYPDQVYYCSEYLAVNLRI